MLNLTDYEIKKLAQLADDKARKTENYLAVLCVEDDEDKAFISENLATIVFYQNLRDKLQTLLLSK